MRPRIGFYRSVNIIFRKPLHPLWYKYDSFFVTYKVKWCMFVYKEQIGGLFWLHGLKKSKYFQPNWGKQRFSFVSWTLKVADDEFSGKQTLLSVWILMLNHDRRFQELFNRLRCISPQTSIGHFCFIVGPWKHNILPTLRTLNTVISHVALCTVIEKKKKKGK